MFITDFKHMLRDLPFESDGYDAFMEHIANEEAVVKPTNAFIKRTTDYSLSKIGVPPSSTDPNPRVILAAIAITRFPIETLETPEEPHQFTLHNQSTKLLLAIDRVLRDHNEAEDDTAEDFLPTATASQFLTSLGEYHAAWSEWFAHDTWASEE
jgi:hypothetical protein